MRECVKTLNMRWTELQNTQSFTDLAHDHSFVDSVGYQVFF